MVSSVDYQSIRADFAQPTSIPENAEIGMVYYVDNDGYLSVIVKNLTSEVLTIDKTQRAPATKFRPLTQIGGRNFVTCPCR